VASDPLDIELYRRILEAVPAGIVHVGASGAIQDANAQAVRILGLAYDRLTRSYVADFDGGTAIREDGSPCPMADFPVVQCLATGEPQPPMTLGIRRSDGGLSWCVFTALPVQDPGTGATSGAVVTFPDVTAHKAAEEQLRSVLESAPDYIVSTDREGRIRFVNRTVPGLDAANVVGHSIFEFAAPGNVETLRADFASVLRTGEAVQREYVVPEPLGGQTYFTTLAPVRDGDVIAGLTIVTRDLTEHRRLEARLSVADRMASMGQLAAGVAHEINNPLTYLLGSLDWLLRRSEGEGTLDRTAVRGMIAAALEGASRIRHVVRDLGTFSHAADRQPAPLDVRPMLESALRMAQSEVRCRARVVREYGDVPKVWASDARLGQVFLNLVVNAAQAIPEGDVEHNEIRVVTRTDAMGRAVVEVADTGAGIPPELLGRVFDPFVTTKAPGVGTGLGLFICRNIVSSMGGEISVTTLPVRGSLFRVVLPVGDAPRGQASTTPVPPPSGRSRRMRVLVVDDEPGIVGLLQQMLGQHQVVTARTGREALALLAEGDFDAVLCDLVMPDLTGMDVYEQLRQQGAGREHRMVFMTGGAFTRRAREFLETVPGRVVEKPFTASAIEEALGALP